jgi:hypothetical protein
MQVVDAAERALEAIVAAAPGLGGSRG